MKLKIVKKAYEIKNKNDYEWEVIFAKSPSDAKEKFINQYFNRNMDSLDLIARRAKEFDIILDSEGKHVARSIFIFLKKEEIRKKQRLEKIMSFPETEMFYIQNGYVGNSISWWAFNGAGYTTNINKAQKYTHKEVVKKFINSRKEDKIWAASHIEKVITQHVNANNVNYEFVA